MTALWRKPNLLSHALFGVSIALFMASLAHPAYVTTDGRVSHVHYGFEALLLGPIGFFAGHFAWVANPLLWMSWIRRLRARTIPALLLALFALPAAGLFPLADQVAVGSAGMYDFHVSMGYYLWLASMAASAVSALTYSRKPPTSTDSL